MRTLSAVLAILALGSPAAANAQTLWLGPKTGANQATWTGEFGTPSNPFGSRTGLTAGATVSLGLGEVLAIQVEALYTQKGVAGPDEFRANVAYLEMPFLLKVALPLHAIHIQPLAMAGLAPAVEISCGALARGAYIPEAPPPPPRPANCISWRTEPRDVGLVLAAGFEVPLRRVKVSAEVRRTVGRSNIALGYEPLSSYNRVWSFLIGTAFPLRK